MGEPRDGTVSLAFFLQALAETFVRIERSPAQDLTTDILLVTLDAVLQNHLETLSDEASAEVRDQISQIRRNLDLGIDRQREIFGLTP